jgi:putative alpha-1,2-mannosidase
MRRRARAVRPTRRARSSAVGREGVEYYNQLGYVPYDVGINENAARTLEYATADFSIAQLAKALGKTEDAKKYRERRRTTRSSTTIRAAGSAAATRTARGRPRSIPYKWGDAFTEGNALHYSWSVMQDVQGLIDLMGGDEKFVERLDAIFTTAADLSTKAITARSSTRSARCRSSTWANMPMATSRSST